MSFQKPFTTNIAALGAGEVKDLNSLQVLSADTFVDGIESGLFVRQDTAVTTNIALSKVDGTATPTILGVAVRDMSATFGALLSPAVTKSNSDVAVKGLITVVVKAGETPVSSGAVFVSNAGDADDGKATATGTDVATNATFLKQIKEATGATDGVWTVQL